MSATEKHQEWTRRYYGGLVGATCKGVETTTDEDGECWPKLIFEHPENGRLEIEVSCDEEGNRPGFLFGLPLPQGVNA